jgi:hypothetical protein
VRRLPVAAFVALVIATVGAFFVTQHLKVSTPLIQGSPAPRPAAFNPVSGRVCLLKNYTGVRVPVDFRRMQISFFLQHQGDDVDVYVVGDAGQIVATLASGRYAPRNHRVYFTWNGRTSHGGYAPDGRYTIRVTLIHQARTITIANGAGPEIVTVERHAAPVAVTGVKPGLFPQAGRPAVTATITGAAGRRPRVLVYRTDLRGGPRVVKSYNATTRHGRTLWDGTIAGGRPAPQGTYLIGLKLTDRACNVARFPTQLAPGAAPHAGVTVRYLAAEPPLTPVPAGQAAVVGVDARRHRYFWALRRAGAEKVLRHGVSTSTALSVRLPGGAAGLYQLALRYGSHRTVVPLIASAPAHAHAKVLVVLPALTWQGVNPVDDDGDGIPNTLGAGLPVRLSRVLANGLPAGFGAEAALVAYLQRNRLAFDLTTDLGLLAGSGPALRGHSGVVLAGDERWLPASLGSQLSTFVEGGGHVLSLGIGSLQRTVTVSGGQAADPSGAHATDALLARPGPVAAAHGALILVGRDDLHIFSATSGALRGYRSYQPFPSVATPARIASQAGVSNRSPAIVGYRLGKGAVVDIGLPGFASTLARNLDAQELMSRVWKLLAT